MKIKILINFDYFFQQFRSIVQQLKHMSKDYIRIESYENAIHSYMQAINQYDIWQRNYPSVDVNHEKALSYLNMSYCLFKLRHFQDAITAADEACSMLPKYYKVRKIGVWSKKGRSRGRERCQGSEKGIRKWETLCCACTIHVCMQCAKFYMYMYIVHILYMYIVYHIVIFSLAYWVG